MLYHNSNVGLRKKYSIGRRGLLAIRNFVVNNPCIQEFHFCAQNIPTNITHQKTQTQWRSDFDTFYHNNDVANGGDCGNAQNSENINNYNSNNNNNNNNTIINSSEFTHPYHQHYFSLHSKDNTGVCKYISGTSMEENTELTEILREIQCALRHNFYRPYLCIERMNQLRTRDPESLLYHLPANVLELIVNQLCDVYNFEAALKTDE
jgi:hypothetical protein